MPTITVTVPAEKLVLSQDGAGQTQPEQSPSETGKLVKANATLAVWLIFFAIGGGILALYYTRIGYLPDMDWKVSLVYLFIGSMVGGTIGLLLTISLFLPGFIWSEIIMFDRYLEKHFSYDAERKEPCMRSIITCLGEPFLLVLLISHMLLLVGKAFYYWTLAGALLVATFWLMRLRFKCILLNSRSKAVNQSRRSGVWQYVSINLQKTSSNALRTLKGKPQRTPSRARQTFKYSFWFTLSVLLSQISMYLIYRLSNSPEMSRRFIALTILCTAVVWISNHVVAFCYRRYPRQAIVAALVSAGLLLFTADKFSCLSTALMNRFGIGYYQKVNLIITDDGAQIIHGMGLQTCGHTRQLCNVEILSKVGDQYYLRIGDQTNLTLPKKDVVAIRRL
jgi:hypothetical protein